jgi:general secretion pathway protein D
VQQSGVSRQLSGLAFLAGAIVVLGGCVSAARLDVSPSRLSSPENASSKRKPESPTQAQEVLGAQAETAAEVVELTDAARRITLLREESRKFDVPALADPAERFSDSDKVVASADGLPARNFINYVFGEVLKANFVIVDGAKGLESPISLSVPKPISSRSLFKLTAELLGGVGLAVVEKEGIYFIGPADEKSGFELPIGYGRRAADVPQTPGKVLQLVPVRFGLNNTLLNALRSVSGAEVDFDPREVAFVIKGNRADVLKALDLLNLFDQPSARGRFIASVKLTFVDPAEFIDKVTKLLANDGIAAGQDQALSFVPMERLGLVIAFASEEALLARLDFWAKQIDVAGESPTGRYFVFQPRFARAADLGSSIASILGVSLPGQPRISSEPRDTVSAMASPSATNRVSSGAAPASSSTSPVGTIVTPDGVRLTVDASTNSLIFYTTGPKYEALLPLINRLDTPPKQVLLEATIAEVTLTGEFARGVEFAFTDGKFEGGTAGGLGLPSGGFVVNFTESLGRTVRAKLQESNGQVNILSNPVLMVRDGFPATIQVGNDVPTVGATASDPIESTRQVTTVQYRKTGLNLSIVPTINAEGAVALSVQQSISSAQPGSSGVSGAPIFFERAVTTDVLAFPGQSILIGGLISEVKSKSSESIPILGRIPLVSEFVSSKSRRSEKTELILLITPRVIESNSDWSDAYRRLSDGYRYLGLSPN